MARLNSADPSADVNIVDDERGFDFNERARQRGPGVAMMLLKGLLTNVPTNLLGDEVWLQAEDHVV
eukprot:3445377-Lingulodinium_polyedra.AAC.1